MRDEELVQKCKNPFFYEANKRMCDNLSELLFDEVKEYIRDNPGCTMKQIVDDTKVKRVYIDKWIMTGRLIIEGGPLADYVQKLNNLKDDVTKLHEDERLAKLKKGAEEREAKKEKTQRVTKHHF